MNACIDIGNTRTKIGFFEDKILQQQAILSDWALEDIVSLFHGKKIERVIVSASGVMPSRVMGWLEKEFEGMELTAETKIPLKNLYRSPKTLGKDRIAVAVGASEMWKKENLIVVQMGTCITYNIVTAEGQYLGGSISPGLQMRLEAMNYFTKRLPLVSLKGDLPLMGYDTETALRSGAVFGMVAEIEGMTGRISQQMQHPFKVILSGGDSEQIFPLLNLKNKFLAPDLVLIGLNIIVNYQKV